MRTTESSSRELKASDFYSVEEFGRLITQSVCEGVCLDCREITVDRCEPDAREGDYECPVCGQRNVIALVELFMRTGY